jgi:hypothetical protein
MEAYIRIYLDDKTVDGRERFKVIPLNADQCQRIANELDSDVEYDLVSMLRDCGDS